MKFCLPSSEGERNSHPLSDLVLQGFASTPPLAARGLSLDSEGVCIAAFVFQKGCVGGVPLARQLGTLLPKGFLSLPPSYERFLIEVHGKELVNERKLSEASSYFKLTASPRLAFTNSFHTLTFLLPRCWWPPFSCALPKVRVLLRSICLWGGSFLFGIRFTWLVCNLSIR